MEPIAVAMDLLEQVYRFLVAARTLDMRFQKTLLKERRHARAFLSDPYLDGWNVVSTAQALAYKALPRPLGTHCADWPWAFRMKLCACLLVAAKWQKGDALVRVDGRSLMHAAMCFMPEVEQARVGSDASVAAATRAAVQSAETYLVVDTFGLSLGEGVIGKAEKELGIIFDKRFLDARETAVARNLCVFQLRAVVRHAAALLENERLPLALIWNALRWMETPPEEVEGQVRALAAEVSALLLVAERKELWVGAFADPQGHTGKYLAVPVEQLVRDD